jgi:hypothetical protein
MVTVERTQTGMRIERRLLKVLKALAEYLDMSLGELVEGIVLHAFEGKAPFGAETTVAISELRKVYGLSLNAVDSHQLAEPKTTGPPATDASGQDGAFGQVLEI